MISKLNNIYSNLYLATSKLIKNNNIYIDIKHFKFKENMCNTTMINNIEIMSKILKNPEYGYLYKFIIPPKK